jgi:hypothetical protein
MASSTKVTKNSRDLKDYLTAEPFIFCESRCHDGFENYEICYLYTNLTIVSVNPTPNNLTSYRTLTKLAVPVKILILKMISLSAQRLDRNYKPCGKLTKSISTRLMANVLQRLSAIINLLPTTDKYSVPIKER